VVIDDGQSVKTLGLDIRENPSVEQMINLSALVLIEESISPGDLDSRFLCGLRVTSLLSQIETKLDPQVRDAGTTHHETNLRIRVEYRTGIATQDLPPVFTLQLPCGPK